ncbi:SMP-30/gluconolactonase/LRE family protein [Steroidobacter sp. S1-65]|uniref:SMP-30/gluconolactonase/LRE family protein n=1 Tax=Steroidobacter gossypii TaxID=2805490 RepID=A0ABS1X096_9GAMM|nr:SMP-30/gluconolactonase/LRE family protein [Steroidobacter gossypii]MBM0106655.1 SMP-30/gluconolactonase/LRE family protein [Steroidobacter gossypii]
MRHFVELARRVLQRTPFALAGMVATAAFAADGAATRIERLDPALDALIAPNATIQRVATGFKFTEGPMWREGRLWFSDLRDNKVYAVTPGGKVELLIESAGGLDPFPVDSYLGSNAMATDQDGSVLLVQQGGRKIVRLDAQLKPTVLLDRYQGKQLNSPNDLAFAPDGSLWFTDPPFGLRGMDKDPAKQLPFNGVYRWAGGKLEVVIEDLTLPNGLAFSPDGKTLYVANFGPERFVKAYDVGVDGAVSNPRMLIQYGVDEKRPGGPDGLKVDSAGNIWTTGPGGIRIITPRGKVLGQLVLPEVAANLAFAEQGKVAYITATSSIYKIALRTPGVMPLYQR